MRWRRFLYRNHVSMFAASTFMAGFLLGRVSVNREWLDLLMVGVWFANATYWAYRLRRESRRELEEFKREMRRTGEEILQRRFQRDIDAE